MSELAPLPAVANEPVSVVLLIRNGVEHLEPILTGWRSFLDARGGSYEVILADLGSSDGTAILAEKIAGSFPALRLSRLPEGTPIGSGLRLGLEQAKFPLVLYTTADGQYSPSDAPSLFRWIDHVALVCGYRRRSWFSRLAAIRERFGRWGIRAVFGLRLKDPHCFYVLARRTALRRARLQSAGAFAHAELLTKTNFLGCLMTDAPVSYQPPHCSTPLTYSPLGQSWTEARHVFAAPDFGPAFLLEDAPWATDLVRALSPFV
jgi:glycosyltransferase involved in cell wall biosynthesis